MTRWPDGDKNKLDNVERLLLKIHNADPKGDAFRYASDKEGKPHLRSVPKTFSLDNFGDVLQSVYNFLDACHMGLIASLDALRDAQSDYLNYE